LTRATLAEASGGQNYVQSAATFLVFCADLQRNQQICQRQQQKIPIGFTEHTLIASLDPALFAQNVLLAALSLGLSGVFIGGLRNQPETVTQLFNLPQQVFTIFGLCLGYPDQNPGQKPRLPISMVLHQDHYSKQGLEKLASYDTQISGYYQQRSHGKTDLTFSQHIIKTMLKEARLHMLSYLHSQGFATR